MRAYFSTRILRTKVVLEGRCAMDALELADIFPGLDDEALVG